MSGLGQRLGRILHALGAGLVLLGDAFAGTDGPVPEHQSIWPGDYLATETEQEES